MNGGGVFCADLYLHVDSDTAAWQSWRRSSGGGGGGGFEGVESNLRSAPFIYNF